MYRNWAQKLGVADYVYEYVGKGKKMPKEFHLGPEPPPVTSADIVDEIVELSQSLNSLYDRAAFHEEHIQHKLLSVRRALQDLLEML